MNSEFMNKLLSRAKKDPKRIAFPESDQEKILRAAKQVLDLGIAYPILIGQPAVINDFADKLNISLNGFEIVDNTDELICNESVARYLEVSQDFSEKTVKRKFKNSLNFAAAMVKIGKADCLAAGFSHTTGEVIFSSQIFIGMQPGISTVSSLGIVDCPNFKTQEGNLLAITDCAVCPQPDSSELSDIAITSAETMKQLLGWEPRVAMLAFSTKGSAVHEIVDKVIESVKISNERRPDLCIDGEFQLDAAIIPAAAAKKVPGNSPVAGKANIIVFPDLNAGNIGVKLIQIFGGCLAYGPLLQGFQKPVTDFSRSAPLDEIVGNLIMLVVRAQKQED